MSSTKNLTTPFNLPPSVHSAFLKIASEQGKSPETLVYNILDEYLEDINLKPPLANDVVNQLREIEDKFKNENVLHLHLFGSIVDGTATRESNINLLVELDEHHPTVKWLCILKIAEQQLGTKFRIKLDCKRSLAPKNLKSVLKNAISIF